MDGGRARATVQGFPADFGDESGWRCGNVQDQAAGANPAGGINLSGPIAFFLFLQELNRKTKN